MAFDLSGDFGKEILRWALDTSENGRPAWRAAVEKEKSDFDFSARPHPFVIFREPTKPKNPSPGAREFKGVNLELRFNGATGSMTKGMVVCNQTKKLTMKTENDGRETEILPQFGFTKAQRRLNGKKLEEVLTLPLVERDVEAPRISRCALYADASFILREDIALMAQYHELCVHKFTNVTNGIQTSYEYKDDNGRTKIQELHREGQICRSKFLFAKKGYLEPTTFLDLNKQDTTGKHMPATIDGEPITKYNIQDWVTTGSNNMIVETWSSVALTTMGKNVQIYVIKLTTNHRPRTERELEDISDEDARYLAEMSAQADQM